MKTKDFAALLLALGLGFAGWHLFAGISRSGSPASVFLPVSEKAPRPAPDFKLEDLEGKPLTLSALKGKVVLLNFWATWCGPCKAEIPDLIALQKKLADQGLVIVGISLDEGGPADVKAFVKKAGINYPIAIGNAAISEAYGGIDAIPTTFIIDREGKIVNGIKGGADLKTFEGAVQPALGAKAQL